MKNFTKKLALLLVFAMVLGVVAPGKVAKAAASSYTFVTDFETLTFRVNKAGSGYVYEYEYTQYVGDTAPTAEKIKEIKEKDWVLVSSDTYAEYGDLSWFNKKKASYIVVRVKENNATDYTYIVSDKIDVQEDALKVLYTDKKEAAATDKTPGYTSAQAVGSTSTGYFVFYRGKKGSFTVITPSAVSFRVDGSYHYYKVKDTTSAGGGVVHDYFNQYLSQTKGAKGATFYFVQAKNYSVDEEGWPVKETKYKYAAQKNAPTLKLDINHVVPLKAGQEYRIVNAQSGNRSAWVNVEDAHGVPNGNKVKVGKILLENLVVTTAGVTSKVLEGGFATEAGTLNPEVLARGDVKLQVRTAATSKAVASKIFSAVVTQQAISATSAASVTGAEGVDVSIDYTVSWDDTKGITIKNNLPDGGATYEYTFTTSGASVTVDNKWSAVKANKSVAVKTLADSKSKEAYTKIWVRKQGDKKKGLLSSNMIGYDLSNITKVTQTITEVTNGTVSGVSGSSVTVTSKGAVTITIPKAAVSGTAIESKNVEVTVSGVTNPGSLKWKTRGTNSKISLDAPTFADNKVKFTIKKIEKDTTGDTTYTAEVQQLTFTVKVVIGN